MLCFEGKTKFRDTTKYVNDTPRMLKFIIIYLTQLERALEKSCSKTYAMQSQFSHFFN